MEREDRFDAFCRATGPAMVHQAFALTGDLQAARSATRDAYVAAWHHWRKASSFADPQDWVRPRAWHGAQRRHTAMRWRRARGLSEQDRRVLEALGRLSSGQRRMLLLTELAGLSVTDAAAELGLPRHEGDQLLRRARATFSVSLDRNPANIRRHLDSLAVTAGRARLPRPPLLRRAGQKRRQAYTLVGVVAAAAVAVGSGALAYEPVSREAGAAPSEVHRVQPAAPDESDPAPAPSAAQLLDADQISRLGPRQTWTVRRTGDNTTGNGINTMCQQTRFADPDGRAALVRLFSAEGRPRRSAVQTVEFSRSAGQAERAFDTTVGWYAGCQVARLQLLKAYRVDGIGDQAELLLLRAWKRPVATYSVAVARIGTATTSTVGKTVGAGASPGQAMQSLADSVSMLCGTSGAADCPQTTPGLAPVPPPPSSEERGILAEVDLPPVGHVNHPWVGTEPRPANRSNPAATMCDQAGFARGGATRTRSRTFLIPQARHLPDRFGLSETYGEFPSPSRARHFISQMRTRLGRCEDRHIAVHVQKGLGPAAGQPPSLTTWRLRTEISKSDAVTFRVGFVRVGQRVAQVTFSPSAGGTMSAAGFRDLLARAAERLHELGAA